MAILAGAAGLFGLESTARAQTAENADARSEAQVRALLPGLQAAGRGRLRFWGFEVYDAALWVSPGFRQSDFAASPLALEMHYLRRFGADEIARVSLEQIRRANPQLDTATAQRWQAQLRAAMTDVQRGDRLLGLYRPGRGAQFFGNGRPLGEVGDAAFARAFFAIWLADTTSEPGLRQALLAGTPP